MEEIQFGAYALPVVLMVLLGLVYRITGENIPNRWKSVIAIVAGCGLGLAGVAYNSQPWTAKVIIDYALYGFMQGAAAVGLWEVTTKGVMNK
jgi:multisubunit Na+/H+ antiporter MnhB subunit